MFTMTSATALSRTLDASPYLSLLLHEDFSCTDQNIAGTPMC